MEKYQFQPDNIDKRFLILISQSDQIVKVIDRYDAAYN